MKGTEKDGRHLSGVTWLMTDHHAEEQVLTRFVGGPSGAVGARFSVSNLGASTFLEAHLQEKLLYLALSDGERWLVLTHVYPSTGCLLWVRFPLPARTVLSLIQSGLLGNVACYPAEPEREPLWDPAIPKILDAWHTVLDCMPCEGAGREEVLRLTHAIAALSGISLQFDASGYMTDTTMMSPDAGTRYDHASYAVMLLLLTSAFAREGVTSLRLRTEEGAEGMIALLSADAPSAAWSEKEELLFCRTLAERNGQLFSCLVRDGEVICRVCAVRKEYSLLGVKDEEDLI